MSGPRSVDGSDPDAGGSGTWCVLVAAGSGERLGGDRPKAFAALGGRPLLAESLDRLEGCEWIESIVIAAPPGWEEPTILLAEELAAAKVSAVVTGGETRAASVHAALGEVPAAALAVVVHDAARPLVDDSAVERVLLPLAEGVEGAIPVLPLVDTVKRMDGDLVAETVDRAGLVRAQTPQAFRADALRSAYAGDLTGATDCASLVERAGGRVKAVPGDPRLLKVTTREDLALIESWLAA